MEEIPHTRFLNLTSRVEDELFTHLKNYPSRSELFKKSFVNLPLTSAGQVLPPFLL